MTQREELIDEEPDRADGSNRRARTEASTTETVPFLLGGTVALIAAVIMVILIVLR